MADRITELLVTEAAVDKLGARGISIDEVQQLADNRYVIVRNPGMRRRSAQPHRARRLVVGHTDGGRAHRRAHDVARRDRLGSDSG